MLGSHHKVTKDDTVYFVPAFSGLLAPYWRSDAKGVICGLTSQTTREQLCYAAFESIAFFVHDLIEAIKQDLSIDHREESNVSISKLRVDGGVSASSVLMEIQAGLGLRVERPSLNELTSLGAAFAAGLFVKAWKDLEDLPHCEEIDVFETSWPNERKTSKFITQVQ